MGSEKISYRELEKKYKEARAIIHAISEGEIDVVIGQHGSLLMRLQKAEKSLKISEEKYRTLIEKCLEGIAVLQNERIVYVNPALQELCGYRSTELKTFSQEKIRNIIHPEDRDRVWQFYRDHLKNKPVPARNEYRIIHKTGKIIWVESSASLINFAGDKAVLVFYVDITARKLKEQALYESNERYQLLTQTATDAIIGMDEFGKISFWNDAATTIFGYSESEALGSEIPQLLIPPDYREKAKSAIEQFVKKGMGEKPGKTIEFEGLHKDGSVFPIELSIGGARKGSGWNATGIIRDITEKKKLQEQFFQAQKMEAIGKLAGGVAHDFNNILTVITGYASLLKTDLNPEDPLYQDIDEISKAGNRATQLTRQLLAFSRKQMFEIEVIDLNDLIADLEKMLKRLLGEDVQFTKSFDDSLLPVKADPGQLEQVLINLAVNARDAMPEGGKLTFETKNIFFDAEYIKKHGGVDLQPGQYSMIAVSDDGIGIDKKIQKQIFEPFFTTKKRGEGTGLGLSTVYGIIKQSDGFVWVYSEKNIGTTFKIYLPSVTEKIEEKPKHSEAVQSLTGSETILVVEDEEMVCELVCRVLKKNGYHVLEAKSGGDALLLCEDYKKPIDLILTDVVMPLMSGKSFVKRLSKLKPVKKVIYMSGYTDNVVVHHGMIEDGVNFIHKPVSPNDLLKVVREVLDT